MKQILMIEDDPAIVRLVEVHLSDLPGRLTATSLGRDGLHKLTHQPFDLCILDVMLPDLDGISICRHIRESDSYMPILMLTAKADEADKVIGLEAGADDYLTKPFGQQEFMARIRALLRRSDHAVDKPAQPTAMPLVHKNVRIDLDKHIVTVDSNRIDLTPREFDLLVLLMQHPGKSFSRKELLHTVWGYSNDGYEHTVTAHVNRLRGKIEPVFAHPVYILTAWGIGYRFGDTDQLIQYENAH